MLFSNARNTGGSSEKSPSALSTTPSRNNPAIGNRDISADDAQGERKISFTFCSTGSVRLRENRQLFTSVR